MMEFIQNSTFGLYICFFLLPFLQEDVSILGAASACASGLGDPFLGFIFTAAGLTTSASLKYGLGRAATSREWAKKYAQNPKILKAGDNVKSNLGKSLYMARFVSAVRIPFYVGAGFFNISFPKFLIFVVSSAVLYLGIAFTLFHLFGEIAGDKMKVYLPIVAIVFLVLYFIYSKIKTPKKTA
ncbi:MAG: VTT domain-containing protein [Litorimonas sp.]